jgi:hypothetical protein
VFKDFVSRKSDYCNTFSHSIQGGKLNGTDIGHTVHSTSACVNIVNHIRNKIKDLGNEIARSKSKISLITDESTTVV